jgi:ABC-type nitrate/sulfonate/bicarbonate transport system substrate-binding protein
MTFPADTATFDLHNATRIVHTDVLRLGFMPLTDCAPLIVAEAAGLFRKHGVAVQLSPLHAWVALRDRMAIGKLDGGQLLAPMPIAATLGLGGVASDVAVVAVMASEGNSITLGEALIAEIEAAAPELAKLRPLPAEALAAALRARKAAGRGAPILAIVYPFSSHNYLLRHWLASAGIDPEVDVALRAVPPPLVAIELAEGRIDGFCAGQPWGSRAVDLRCGRIVLGTGDIWPGHPEKVMAVSAAYLDRAPDRVAAAVAAIIEAGEWLSDPANLPQAARWLHLYALPQVPLSVVMQSLAAKLPLAPDEAERDFAAPRFNLASTYPHPEHGSWWLTQMQRWGHAPTSARPDSITRLWRPDIWARAVSLAGLNPARPIPAFAPGEIV